MDLPLNHGPLAELLLTAITVLLVAPIFAPDINYSCINALLGIHSEPAACKEFKDQKK